MRASVFDFSGGDLVIFRQYPTHACHTQPQPLKELDLHVCYLETHNRDTYLTFPVFSFFTGMI
jgi:hypothetical protein